MTYTTIVEPASIREAKIAELERNSTKTEPFYAFQNRTMDMPIIIVPIALPVYRMLNYRTRIAQQAYARREKKPVDYFSTGEENESAQHRQHEFLLKYAHEGRQGSITPIIDVLKIEKQTQPILITRRGVVVNGNRRLAAMRHLYDSDSTQFREFSHVKCQVLPPTATESEIVDVEVRLQMKQRTELDYDWIIECLALKELRDEGRKPKEMMAMTNKKKVELDDAIGALCEADLYLAEWLNRPGEYEAIEDAKQLFFDMGENLRTKTGDELEVSRRIAWLLADRRSTLKRRVYDFKPMFGKKSDEVAAKLAERFAVEIEDGTDAITDDSDDFDVDIEDGRSSLRPLISLLEDPTRRDEMGAELVDVCESMIAMQRDKRDGQMPLTLIQQANGKLTEVDMSRAAPDSFKAIEKQLDQVQVNVDRMRAHIEREALVPQTARAPSGELV